MTKTPICIVFGAGGQARMVIDAIRVSAGATIAGILDPDSARGPVDGIAILGDDTALEGLASRGVTHFVVAVGGTGDNGPRRRLFERALAAGLTPLTVRHPSALISPAAVHGAACQFMPGCIVNAGASLGRNIIINSGAIVEHDCSIGDHVHVATGARLAGNVTVGEGAHVGIGASILQGRRIGDGSIVGGGAVVVADVPARTIVVGVPARALRPVQQA